MCFELVRSFLTFWVILGPTGPILRGVGPIFHWQLDYYLWYAMWSMWQKPLAQTKLRVKNLAHTNVFWVGPVPPDILIHFGTIWTNFERCGTDFSLVVGLLPLIYNVKYVTEKHMAQTKLRVRNLAHAQWVESRSGRSWHFESIWDQLEQSCEVWDRFFTGSWTIPFDIQWEVCDRKTHGTDQT